MKKTLSKAILFCTLFFTINLILGYFLELPKERLIKDGKFFHYQMWQDFYLQPHNSLDLFFLGSSHTYRSFNPEIFDAALGSHSFNLGTSDQTPMTSYFVLKEILNTQKPKSVILEVYWLTLMKGDQFRNASYNYEYIRSPNVREEFYRDGFDWKGRMLLIFPSYRYRNNLNDVFRLATGKVPGFEDKGEYKVKGYVEASDTVRLKDLNKQNEFDGFLFKKQNIERKQILYIKKIVDLCRSRGISIVFITAPLPPVSLGKVTDYRNIHDYINQLALGLNVPYMDTNTDAPKGLFNNEDFMDEGHLNKTGVRKFDAYLLNPGTIDLFWHLSKIRK